MIVPAGPDQIGVSADRILATIAENQWGRVARRQLLALGISRHTIAHRLASGNLIVVHPGVYAVGHRTNAPKGRWMAAVLAGGDGALVSHCSGTALWGLRPSDGSAVDVTTPSWRRSRPGVRFHTSVVPDDERAVRHGIPVTSMPRTILDFAACAPAAQVERAIHEAEVLGLTDELSLMDVVERHAGRRGCATVRAVLAELELGAQRTRSELEERFLALIDQYNIERPLLNRQLRAGGRVYEVDCVWSEARLVVELDGHATHATRRGYERDRRRDRALQREGWRVIRVTWRMLVREADQLVDDLRVMTSP